MSESKKHLNYMLHLIREMHRKFEITHEQVPFSPEEKDFRVIAMQEELDEYRDADSLEERFDAIIDLVVFALGTAEREGMLDVFEGGYTKVMCANMAKELGGNEKRGGFQLDLRKPEGWRAPDHSDLLVDLKVELANNEQ